MKIDDIALQVSLDLTMQVSCIVLLLIIIR